jgi:hypothetical protein
VNLQLSRYVMVSGGFMDVDGLLESRYSFSGFGKGRYRSSLPLPWHKTTSIPRISYTSDHSIPLASPRFSCHYFFRPVLLRPPGITDADRKKKNTAVSTKQKHQPLLPPTFPSLSMHFLSPVGCVMLKGNVNTTQRHAAAMQRPCS